jgi:hypothetical protein
MIIIRGSKVATLEEAERSVRVSANGYVVTERQIHPDSPVQSFEFNRTLLEFVPDIMYVTKNIWGVPTPFWQSEIGHARDGYASIALRKKIAMARLQEVIAMVAAVEGGDHLIVYGNVFVEDDSEVTVLGHDHVGTGCDIFEQFVPAIVPFLKHTRAKQNALARFNAVDAIAGLEYQVDLMTAALKALIAANPASKPVWWDDFEAAVLNKESTGLVGIPKAIQVVGDEKAKARATQEAYFNELTA